MDRITRAVCRDLNLRVYTVEATESAAKIAAIHKTSPNGTIALCRTLVATALTSSTLKPGSDQNVTVKFSGDGPVKEIQVQADAKGSIRGYIANPAPELVQEFKGINFSKAIGAGFLTVIRDLNLKEPYTSVTPLIYGDVASNMSLFFTESDQVPSAMILSVEPDPDKKVKAAGGILIQTFPDTKPDAIDTAVNLINHMEKPLGRMLLEGTDIIDAAEQILGGRKMEIVSESPVQLRCRCSKEMLKNVIMGIQKDELEQIIKEDHRAEITCSFCNSVYIFNEDELTDILNEKLRILH